MVGGGGRTKQERHPSADDRRRRESLLDTVRAEKYDCTADTAKESTRSAARKTGV